MDLLFHMLFPVMFAMIAGVDRKRAVMLAPLAIIPDLDVFFMAHRVYLHAFTPLLAIATPLLLYGWRVNQKHFQTAVLATLYLFSHLLLDFFSGCVALFWPLTNMGYGLSVYITATQHSIFPTFQLVIQLRQEIISTPNVLMDAALITPESTVLLVLFLLVLGRRSLLKSS